MNYDKRITIRLSKEQLKTLDKLNKKLDLEESYSGLVRYLIDAVESKLDK